MSAYKSVTGVHHGIVFDGWTSCDPATDELKIYAWEQLERQGDHEGAAVFLKQPDELVATEKLGGRSIKAVAGEHLAHHLNAAEEPVSELERLFRRPLSYPMGHPAWGPRDRDPKFRRAEHPGDPYAAENKAARELRDGWRADYEKARQQAEEAARREREAIEAEWVLEHFGPSGNWLGTPEQIASRLMERKR
jgi:hypothetical protein